MEYVPYTYLLIHIPTSKLYYGCKAGKSKGNIANPETFWKDYFTSSKEVHRLIAEFGRDSFRWEIRRIFRTGEEAMRWEARVLARLNAAKKNEWLNQHNGGRGFHLIGQRSPDHVANLKKNHVSWNRGKSHSAETREKMRNAHVCGRNSISNIRDNYVSAYMWEITSPCGERNVVDSVQEFGKDRGWSKQAYAAASKGKPYRGHIINRIPR